MANLIGRIFGGNPADQPEPTPPEVGPISAPDDIDNDGELDHEAEFPPNESQTRHIFGDRPGHVPDTPENRERIRDTVSKENYRGTDEHGNQRYTETHDDGTQTWVNTRDGTIQNAGVNSPGNHK